MLLVCSIGTAAQADSTPAKPSEQICISREAAERSSKAFDTVKAQEKEIAELKAIIEDLKIQYAMETQKTIDLEAEQKRNDAMIEYLLKNPRRVFKVGLINF